MEAPHHKYCKCPDCELFAQMQAHFGTNEPEPNTRAGGDGSTWNPLDFDVFPSLKVLADTIARLDVMQAERDKARADLAEIDRNAEEGGWSFPDAAAKAKRVAAIAAPYRVETDLLVAVLRGKVANPKQFAESLRTDPRWLEIGRSA